MAVVAKHLGRKSFGQAVRGKVRQPLGAGTFAALEDTTGQKQPATAGLPESFKHKRQVIGVISRAATVSKSGLL